MRDGRQQGGRGGGGHPSGRRHVWQDVSPDRIVLVVVLVAEVLYRPFNNVCHKADTDSGQGRHRVCVYVCVCARHCPTAATVVVVVVSGTSHFRIYMARP